MELDGDGVRAVDDEVGVDGERHRCGFVTARHCAAGKRVRGREAIGHVVADGFVAIDVSDQTVVSHEANRQRVREAVDLDNRKGAPEVRGDDVAGDAGGGVGNNGVLTADAVSKRGGAVGPRRVVVAA